MAPGTKRSCCVSMNTQVRILKIYGKVKRLAQMSAITVSLWRDWRYWRSTLDSLEACGQAGLAHTAESNELIPSHSR